MTPPIMTAATRRISDRLRTPGGLGLYSSVVRPAIELPRYVSRYTISKHNDGDDLETIKPSVIL